MAPLAAEPQRRGHGRSRRLLRGPDAPAARLEAVDPVKVAAGQLLVDRHHCTSCHMPSLAGQQQVPRLAGQDLAYLLRLLRGFRAGTASDLDGTMTMAAPPPLTVAEIVSLVHYISTLGPDQ